MTDYNLRVFDSMLDMMSSEQNPTPLVRLNRVVPFRHTQVYAKLEWYNPFGAVKDRVAGNLVADAEKRGLKLSNLVEPTSGNTGMGLAMVCNSKGYRLTATLSQAIPVEKRATLRVFGAQLVELADDLCPMPGAPEGAMQKATELGNQPGWTQLNQYKNPANPEAHFLTTGPEVWRQTAGKVTHFVSSLGTCGTITGTGRFLKSKNPAIKVLGVHPEEGHDIPGVRSKRALKLTDFFLPQEYDGVAEVTTQDAFALNKRLLQEECIIAGPSSAMALVGALRLVADEPGNVCVVMFPDNAFKYVSSYRKHLPELFPDAGAAATSAPVGPSADEIDGDRATELVRQGAFLVDVRSPAEFAQVHIAESVNVPLTDLQADQLAGLPGDRSQVIVAVCGVGKRSLVAAQLLKSKGYRSVHSVAGGLSLWQSQGRPWKLR